MLVCSTACTQGSPGELLQVVVPVMNRWKEIETCLECSAKQLIFVGEVFYYALKAVVHPTAPLFDPQANSGQGALKPLCVKALKRIFIMCDKDKVSTRGFPPVHSRVDVHTDASLKMQLLEMQLLVFKICRHLRSGAERDDMFATQDGALSDDELNAFQVRCFSMPLQPDELLGVKNVVSEKMPQVRYYTLMLE